MHFQKRMLTLHAQQPLQGVTVFQTLGSVKGLHGFVVDAYTTKACSIISSKHLKPQKYIWLRGCVDFTERLC